MQCNASLASLLSRASIRYCSGVDSSSLVVFLCVDYNATVLYCTCLYTGVQQESGEQTERGCDSQSGGTQPAGEKVGPVAGSSIIGQPTKEVATTSSRGGGGEQPTSPGVNVQQARMSPLPKEQARVTFCTTPTSPTANSSSKPPLQVPLTMLINLIHGEIVHYMEQHEPCQF